MKIAKNRRNRVEKKITVEDGLMAIAESLKSVARAIDRLGNADAATNMGGLEAHGVQIKEASERIAEAIRDASDQ